MLKNVKLSLADILGENYIDEVCRIQSFFSCGGLDGAMELAHRKVAFFPEEFAARIDELALLSGEQVCKGFDSAIAGAPTDAFKKAQHNHMAPLSGMGCTRIGEDGRAYFIGKSEHYHASLGHQFPGYELLHIAQQLGILNATHNNTRGFITRKMEREIVRLANRIPRGDEAAIDAVLNSPDETTLNRIINLETGSLAVESALKMMLARFSRLDQTYPAPCYHNRIPVILVMADNNGTCEANYHGTTILTQLLRGMWPDFARKLEEQKLCRIIPVKLNDCADLDAKIARYEQGEYKVAGIFHELVLMNYGGIKLTEKFVRHLHEQARKHDIPVMVDEIQSCMWTPDQFMFLDYGITPDFVSLGKGFPGGQYPASKVLTNKKMDTLNQFGALVTNGQEELASLSYLVTMYFAEDNRAHIREISDYYRQELLALFARFPYLISGIEGDGLMSTIVFNSTDHVIAFAKNLNRQGIDVSAQTYKANCPPVALTKLPLITSKVMVDFLVGKMAAALEEL